MSSSAKRKELMHPLIYNYKNEIEFVDKLITIYSTVAMKADKQLRKFEKDVLNYYMRFGFSTNTKKIIQSELGKTPDTITQATFYLKKKGYLVDSRTNMSKKNLNKDLQALKESFIDGDKKILAIGLKRGK